MENDLDRWPDVQSAIAALAEGFVTAFLPIAAAVNEFADAMNSAIWESYRAAGSPYGESTEGMQRFFREAAAFQQALDKYREQRSWRRSLVQLRERFAQEPS